MYPVGTGTKEDFEKRWYIAFGFGEKASYGYHEGIDINLKTGGDTDLGEPVIAIADYKLVYYHLKSHPESGFGIHYVYETDTPRGKRWIHCAHNEPDPAIFNKKQGKAGDILSHIGKSGRPRNILPAHLHFACFRVDPAGLPNGIDTIAKTTQQLNDWWDDPLEVIKSLQEENNMPDWFNTLLQERNLTIEDEGEIRAIFDRAKRYDDEVAELKEQVKSANESLADKSLEVSTLMDKVTRLEGTVAGLQENLNQARSERDQAIGDREKLSVKVQALEAKVEDMGEKIARMERENDIHAYTWWERLTSLFSKGGD